MRIACLSLLFAFSLAAQTARQTQTFDFTNSPGPAGLNQMATILRVVGGLTAVSVDPEAPAIKVTGIPDELAMSGWIIRNLDQAAPSPEAYLVAGKSDDAIRVFHLTRAAASPPQAIQELLTVIRTIGDVQKTFHYVDHADVVVRGRASELRLVEFLVGALDRTPDAARAALAMSPEHHYAWAKGTDTVRVYYLAHSSAPREMQEILTNLRTVLDIQRVFNFTALHALVVRGTPETIAAAEWMIRSLDVPADAKGPTREFTAPSNMPGGAMIHVLYPVNLKDRALKETLTKLRTDLKLQKVFLKTAPATLVVRGSADQVDRADQLVQAADKAARP
jgi:type II secretory pathway component GspD/PulD (secretin)